MDQELNIDTYLYNNRKAFSIVALTGVLGSDIFDFAQHCLCRTREQILQNEDKSSPLRNLTQLVSPESYKAEKHYDYNTAAQRAVFNRKYTICYNYFNANYEQYEILKYNKVLWMYVIKKIITQCQCHDHNELKEEIKKLVFYNYKPSKKLNNYSITEQELQQKIEQTIDEIDIDEQLFIDIYALDFEHLNDKENKNRVGKYFFDKDSKLQHFYDTFNEQFRTIDYYCFCFFYHRLTNKIRCANNPFTEDDYKDKTIGLFNIVRIIDELIDYRYKEEGYCRICIDAIRNSLEANYLKERIQTFYLVAVHNEDADKQIEKTVKHWCKDNATSDMIKGTQRLARLEAKSSEFTSGCFAVPNIEKCIADAEIHIVRHDELNNEAIEFYTTAEQWMKYATLMLHPGLITPSFEERCMEVAYTAKFNSGCISRQVGAVITNSSQTIRSIGWNDVPYGQTACALRDLNDICGAQIPQECKDIYSDFERGESNKTNVYKDDETFTAKVKKEYGEVARQFAEQHCMPLAFCFKQLHNRYSGESNQVFTRSLHAEENAMMQMVKYGGEALKDGTIYVTASPCELCCKKLYQIGVRKIVYIDPYPGIAREQIIPNGYHRPELQIYKGAYGATYYKLYTPLIDKKDEINLRITNNDSLLRTRQNVFESIMAELGEKAQFTYTKEQEEIIINKIKALKK